MKKNFLYTTTSLITFFVLLVGSVFAWFYTGYNSNSFEFISSFADCKVELFRVDNDYFQNQVLDDDIDLENFNVLHTTYDNYEFLDEDVGVKIFSEDDKYIMTGIMNSESRVVLTKVEKENHYTMRLFPTQTAVFAVAITSKNRNSKQAVGKVELLFENNKDFDKLGEVISINFDQHKKLLVSDAEGEKIPLFTVRNNKEVLIKYNHTLWLFFYYKFENLEVLKQINAEKFGDMRDLNSYATSSDYLLPKLFINYLLLDVVDN